MNRLNVLAAAVLVLGVFACERKNEPTPSETRTTSGDIQQDRNAATETTGGTTITSDAVDHGNVQVNGTTPRMRDAGVSRDYGELGDMPVAPRGTDMKGTSTSTPQKSPDGTTNHSTTLGDGKSGEYTGGQGTYGGKSTHGTGPGSDIVGKKDGGH